MRDNDRLAPCPAPFDFARNYRGETQMKLYEPQPSRPDVPAVVIEDEAGRFLVTSAGCGTDVTKAYERRTPYDGAVRKDPVATALRGVAWSLGVPNALTADVPNG